MKKPDWDNVKDRIEHADDGSSLWVKLRENGDKVVGVFLGDPYPREVVWTGEGYVDAGSPEAKPFLGQGKKPSLRIVINLAVKTEQGFEVKALEQTASFFKDVMKVDQKYGLEGWSFEIERHGASGDPKTTYSILPEDKLTKADVAALDTLELLDLASIYDESLTEAAENRGKGGKDGKFGEYDEEKVPDKVADALIVVLKELPRESTDRFLERFEIRRVRDLALKDKKAAIEFLDELEAEAKKASAAAAEVDPFA